MKKIDSFINQYDLLKTLRFKLIPVGETEKNFSEELLLNEDAERAKAYVCVKKYIDAYHRDFIDKALSGIKNLDISKYAELYYKSERDKNEIKKESENLRKQIAKAFSDRKEYSGLFKKDIVESYLPAFLADDEAKENVGKFKKFSGYFTEFHENRKNIYTAEEKSTGIAYRCVNDNLPKFLNNIKVFEKVRAELPAEDMDTLKADFEGLIGFDIEELFTYDKFVYVLTGDGIRAYNNVIGGYTAEAGVKINGIKGLNQYINLYNQNKPKEQRLPFFKTLFKQILSVSETISFIPEKFISDDETLSAISYFYNAAVTDAMDRVTSVFDSIELFDADKVYYKSDAVQTLSSELFSEWHVFKDAWRAEYDREYKGKNKKKPEKYQEEKNKAEKAKQYFSLSELISYSGEADVIGSFKEKALKLTSAVKEKYASARELIENEYPKTAVKLIKNGEAIFLIKELLDSVKELERFIKPFICEDTSVNKDESFYAELETLIPFVKDFSALYDKVRNYVTQKPYSTDKIKLNFRNPYFMNGWDRNKESDCSAVILRNKDSFYLAVMDNSTRSVFKNYPVDGDNGWNKLEYKLLPGPNKMLPKVFFAASNIEFFAPSDEIMEIYENGTFKKGDTFSADDCHKLIQFYQDSIAKHPDWSAFGFEFKKAEEYADISEFYRDVETQGYKLQMKPISEKYIFDKVASGEIYLFKLYCKDFSKYSKGKPNLHTLYFKMLFDERNLEDTVYQLNGGAELFYRPQSLRLEETAVHPANEPVQNKNPKNKKKTSTFGYDLIKDKRFTEPHFELHLPITLNFKSQNNLKINAKVCDALRECENNYVIGIDRGERNLVYITVVDGSGKIIEQFSLNEIETKSKDTVHVTDYRGLLDEREDKLKSERKSWQTVETIKELKEGYVSQVVHKICELVEKYDAVIAMEDLSKKMKESRIKVGKQVYQKLEKMLIDKLSYFADKEKDIYAPGGLLRAYQLTEKFESFEKMTKQNGFIFYVPAWLTSKIDPVTGFADLLKPRYVSVDESIKFVKKFDSIRWNSEENMYEFSFDYSNFTGGSIDSKKKWTVYANGDRIERVKLANGKFDEKAVNLTDEFKKLFEKWEINDDENDMISSIASQKSKELFAKFMRLLMLTLQMRNSISNSDVDYLISPVKDKNGNFYDSRKYNSGSSLPADADANGAYNIARKALWAINEIKNAKAGSYKYPMISKKEWLEFAQNHE